MARQLILIVRCFKQLKAKENMDRGAKRNKAELGSGEKIAWQAVTTRFLLSLTTLFLDF